MPEAQIWACPKCETTASTPMAVQAFYKPCRCGNKRDWKRIAGPPRPEDKRVRSSKKKENN